MVGRVFGTVLLVAGALCAPAAATPVFTFTLSPGVVSATPGSRFSLDATVRNTGSTTITQVNGAESTELSSPGWLLPYLTGTGYFSGLYSDVSDLTPGESVTFPFVYFDLASDTPAGTYNFLDITQTGINLGDDIGDSAMVDALNAVRVEVRDVPEPASWAMLLLGLPAAWAAARLARVGESMDGLLAYSCLFFDFAWSRVCVGICKLRGGGR